jgi:hypothetical protein
MAILFLSNLFFLLQALRYRNVVIQRNKCYQETTTFPRYKNINNQFKMLQKNPRFYYNPTVFIDSSIIERWDFEEHFRRMPFINRGVGENTSSDVPKRFRDDVLELGPLRVVIYLGTNDVRYNSTIEQSRKNLEMMLELSLGNGIQPLVLFLLPVEYNKTLHCISIVRSTEYKNFVNN